MNSNESPTRRGHADEQSDLRAFAELVEHAIREAAKEAIEDHHRAGNPVAIWRDGQVVLWYPDGSFRPVTEERAGES